MHIGWADKPRRWLRALSPPPQHPPPLSHRTPRPHATHRGYQFQFLSRISPVNPRDPGAVALTTPHHKETAGETEGFPAPARLCLRGLLQKQAQSERTVSPGTVSIAVSGLADETR